MVSELEERITDMRNIFQEKEYAIQELEKIKPLPDGDGIIVKFKEIVAPSEQNMKLHEELEIANQTKSKLGKYAARAHDEKQELMGINFVRDLHQEKIFMLNRRCLMSLRNLRSHLRVR